MIGGVEESGATGPRGAAKKTVQEEGQNTMGGEMELTFSTTGSDKV